MQPLLNRQNKQTFKHNRHVFSSINSHPHHQRIVDVSCIGPELKRRRTCVKLCIIESDTRSSPDNRMDRKSDMDTCSHNAGSMPYSRSGNRFGKSGDKTRCPSASPATTDHTSASIGNASRDTCRVIANKSETNPNNVRMSFVLTFFYFFRFGTKCERGRPVENKNTINNQK